MITVGFILMKCLLVDYPTAKSSWNFS